MFTKCLLLLSSVTLLAAHRIPVHRGPLFEDRIVGGRNESIENAPWLISLQYKNKHYCGGSIYNELIIVTAAHCVEDENSTQVNASDLKVRVGSSNKKEGGTLFDVAKFISHKEFNLEDARCDVAVILLKKPLNLKDSNRVRAIKLAEKTPAPGSHATVVGWGSIVQENSSSQDIAPLYPDILQSIVVNIVDHEECRKSYENLTLHITKEMICTFLPGKGFCDGDSGGPLVSNGQLVGIVSGTEACASDSYPDVYTDVAVLRKWIVAAARKLQNSTNPEDDVNFSSLYNRI